MKKLLCTFTFMFLFPQITFALDNDSNPKEKVLMSATDINNPFHTKNLELTDYWVKLSDDILKDYKEFKLTPHQLAIIFIDYIDEFKLGYAKGGSNPKYNVEEKVGSCGAFTNIFNALMAVNGYKVRAVGLYNFPKENGHVVAEVLYDNKWHLYDTTYGGYFTTDPSNIIDPYVLSFEEIKENKPSTLIIHNHSRYYKTLGGRQFINREIYLNANPSGPLEFDNKLYFPIDLDLINKPAISQENFRGKAQGAAYIGIGGVNANHTYKLTNLEDNGSYNLSITPSHIGGQTHIKNNLDKIKFQVSSKDCKVSTDELIYINKDKNDIVLNFKAIGNSCTITIENNEPPIAMKYLLIKKISLSKM